MSVKTGGRAEGNDKAQDSTKPEKGRNDKKATRTLV